MSDDLDDIQAVFFEECAEGLAAAEAGLSAMQDGDTTAGTIASVFRAVHSIKGGAGAFGHAALTAFAHRFENTLDEIRAGRIASSAAHVAVMLQALDILSDHVAAAQGGPVPDDSAALAALEAVLAGTLTSAEGAACGRSGDGEPAPDCHDAPAADDDQADAPADAPADEHGFVPVAIDLDTFDIGAEAPDLPEFAEPGWRIDFRPSRAALAHGGEPLLIVRELEELGGRVTGVDCDALPSLRELDPEGAYLGWTIVLPAWIEAARIDEAFDFVAPDSVIAIAREMPTETIGEGAAEDDAVVPAAPLLSLVEAPAGSAPPADVAGAATAPARPAEQAHQTIRVDLARLDSLLNLVGELVIRNSILADRLDAKDQQRVELPELGRLTREIQDNVMSLRAQPIRQAFSRVPRLLRDLAAETGKQAQIVTFGEMTEVDKGVIEKIGEPLTHLVRNAVDHGLELPAERLRAGKPASGLITLSAEQRGARILISVSDDGRGIDRSRVRAKAIEKGLIAADAVLSDEEIDQLICAPGFSTAQSVSNISGRGVGMDVVRSNVEALGGRVEISSIPGKGTSFTLVLPLTLAILDGMIVRLDGQRYVLPLATVVEALRPEPGQVRSTSPTNEVIDVRGRYLPVRRLSHLFNAAGIDRPAEESLVIVVETEAAGHVGLLVDTIDERREVVVKSLEQNLQPISGLGGATILGDGTIALILDIEALVTAPVQAMHVIKGLAA